MLLILVWKPIIVFMETSSNSKRFLTWGIFIVIVGLVIWGLVAAQQKSAREEVNLVLPDQISETDWSRGSTVAPVTLVEYGDFQCPACALYKPLVEQVIADAGPEKLRFVFRHFPLPSHFNAIPASKAAEAAGEQNKFWEMYNLLYERQQEWSASSTVKATFTRYAQEIGLDVEKFATDFESPAIASKINSHYKGGVKAGINATPTFFVNGKKINSPQTFNEFKKIIDDAVPKLDL